MLVYSKGHPSVERRSSRRKVFFFRLSKRQRKKRKRRRRSTASPNRKRFPFPLVGEMAKWSIETFITDRARAVLRPSSAAFKSFASPSLSFFLLPRDSGGVAKKIGGETFSLLPRPGSYLEFGWMGGFASAFRDQDPEGKSLSLVSLPFPPLRHLLLPPPPLSFGGDQENFLAAKPTRRGVATMKSIGSIGGRKERGAFFFWTRSCCPKLDLLLKEGAEIELHDLTAVLKSLAYFFLGGE